MGTHLVLFFFSSLLPNLSISGYIHTNSIPPNFTATNFQFIDTSGIFLTSSNQVFQASISNLETTTSNYYFSIIHNPSNAIVWTANRNTPISNSDKLHLTSQGLRITRSLNASSLVWSTPELNSTSGVSFLQLQDTGNLVLVDKNNVSLWESFDYPTDTILSGQRVLVGNALCACLDEKNNLSEGDYKLVITSIGAVLQWKGETYGKLSMDTAAYNDSNEPVSFLSINDTGLFLLPSDGSGIAFKLVLGQKSGLKMAKLWSNGKFSLSSIGDSREWDEEFRSPSEDCGIPAICPPTRICSAGICSCPANFRSSNGTCALSNTSLSLQLPACKDTPANSLASYATLGPEVGYFAIGFVGPTKRGINLSACEDLCSQNCSCLAFFHSSSSGSCFLLENQLGSFMSVPNTDPLGYIRAVVISSPGNLHLNDSRGDRNFPVAGLVLLPSSGAFLLVIFVALGLSYWRRTRISGAAPMEFGRTDSSSSDLETVLIPGLPVRFSCEEIQVATESFKTVIGSGGFGTVYKGTLPDKSLVAVKKINAIGVRGKKEFCTEIAIIGTIHHINLVKLKGFCAQGNQRFLVYEFMNRGSLDRALFGADGPVLEWRERHEIALGTARGLAYLHSGCDHKIIHCDVKPENILLHDNLQVKISDFGLSKLLSPEQSSLLTTLRGTRGYLPPEWLTGSTISDKADVYSFGMVLLEIVTGRKNSSLQIQSHSTEKDSNKGTSSGGNSQSVYFPLLALQMHEKRRYLELADSRIRKQVREDEVEKLICVALCCLHEDPTLRPSMANVVGTLEGVVPLGMPRLESLNFLRLYGRRFTEDSKVGESNEQNELMLLPIRNFTSTSTATSDS